MAAPQGFEPRLPDPESGVLPLDEGAAQSGYVLLSGQNGQRTIEPAQTRIFAHNLHQFEQSRPETDPAKRQPGGMNQF